MWTESLSSSLLSLFCYIGERHLDQALEQYGLKDSVEIEWHSFELAPDAVTNPDAIIYEELGRRKGWALEQSAQPNRKAPSR